jgi:hypothetical protein
MMSHLCNCGVRELLILARTWFAFGLPSKTGCDIGEPITNNIYFPILLFVKPIVLAFFLLEELLFFLLIIFLALEFIFLGLAALMSKMAKFSTIVSIHLRDGLFIAREKFLLL